MKTFLRFSKTFSEKALARKPLLRLNSLENGDFLPKYTMWYLMTSMFYLINQFHATDLFWYPLKTLENLWFSGGFRRDQWYKMS